MVLGWGKCSLHKNRRSTWSFLRRHVWICADRGGWIISKTWPHIQLGWQDNIINNSLKLYDKSEDICDNISVDMEDRLYEGSEFTLCHLMSHLAEIRLKFKSAAGESVAYHMVSMHCIILHIHKVVASSGWGLKMVHLVDESRMSDY